MINKNNKRKTADDTHVLSSQTINAMCGQVVAHHFCSHVSGDMRQCIIYDSNKADAKLIGIEYIISRKLFETLPMEERKYWHSHEFEVLLSSSIPVVFLFLLVLRCPVGAQSILSRDTSLTRTVIPP